MGKRQARARRKGRHQHVGDVRMLACFPPRPDHAYEQVERVALHGVPAPAETEYVKLLDRANALGRADLIRRARDFDHLRELLKSTGSTGRQDE